MKLVLQYKQKGDKPEIVFSSNDNQEVADKFDELKGDSFSTEIWTLGFRQKAYYGEPKVKKPEVKKATKKAALPKTED